MVFAAPPKAGEDGRPLRSLVAFERLKPLNPGQRATTSLNISAHHFTLATEPAGRRLAARGTWLLWVGPDGEEKSTAVDIV